MYSGIYFYSQIVVLAISSFLYILIIFSYVNPIQVVIDKQIRVRAKEPRTHDYRPGVIVSYIPNTNASDIDECKVRFDDDDSQESRVISERHIRILKPVRGHVTHMLHYIYKKLLRSSESDSGSDYTINLGTELTLLSIEFESSKEENRLERYCIIFGWILLACGYPGIAALRAFRVFRILWYYKIPTLQKYLNFNSDVVFFNAELEEGMSYICLYNYWTVYTPYISFVCRL
jgi:hypothetical protein